MKYLSRKILLFDTSLRSLFLFLCLPLPGGFFFTREWHGRPGLTDGVTLTGASGRWGVRQGVNLF